MSELIYKGALAELRPAATVLTTSYVATSAQDVGNDSFVTFELTYTKVGTLLKFYAEISLDGGTTYGYAEVMLDSSGSVSAGLAVVPLGAKIYSLDTTLTFMVTVPCYGATHARLKLLETGASGGTCRVRVVPSRVGA